MDEYQKEKLKKDLKKWGQIGLIIGFFAGMFIFGRYFFFVIIIAMIFYGYIDWELNRSKELKIQKEEQGGQEIQCVNDEGINTGSKFTLEIDHFGEWDDEPEDIKDNTDKFLVKYAEEQEIAEKEVVKEKAKDRNITEEKKEEYNKNKKIRSETTTKIRETYKEELKEIEKDSQVTSKLIIEDLSGTIGDIMKGRNKKK